MHPALAAYTSTCTSTFTHALSLIERVILQVPVQVPVSVWGPEGAQRGPALIFDPRMHATTHLFSGRTHRRTVLARLGMRECRPSPLGLTHPMRCHTRACAPQHTAFGMAGSGTDASQLNVCRATSSCMAHGSCMGCSTNAMHHAVYTWRK